MRRPRRAMAEINVVPYIDVMLVLLIIFMVTAPRLASGMKIDLPNAQAARPLAADEPVVVTIGKDGRLQVGAEEVAADDLVAAVRARIGDDSNRVVRIRGDRDAAYGAIVSVLDLLASNGLTHLAIVADRSGRTPAPAVDTPPADAPERRGPAPGNR